MSQPKSLLEFRRMTHSFYTAYFMSDYGMANMVSDFEEMEGYDPEGNFQLGTGSNSDGSKTALAEMKNKRVMEAMSSSGPFSQIIAHGIISYIFTLWDVTYRKEIAVEIGVEENDVMCDVIGDLRVIRNFIAHRIAKADKSVEKLKEINWFKEGPLVITGEDMSKIQQKINTMAIYTRN